MDSIRVHEIEASTHAQSILKILPKDPQGIEVYLSTFNLAMFITNFIEAMFIFFFTFFHHSQDPSSWFASHDPA